MSPIHDHADLFLAPSAPSTARTPGRPGSAVDGSAAAMRRLRHPFAVFADQSPEAAETSPAL